MASRIQPKQASAATTGVACLVGAVAWILISSIYVGNTEGWPQFVLSAFAAATVCAVAASSLAYAAYQQYVVKNNLFVDQCADEFDYRSTGQWAGEYIILILLYYAPPLDLKFQSPEVDFETILRHTPSKQYTQ